MKQTHNIGKANHYQRLLVMLGLSFLAMFVLMYAMVNSFSDIYPNFNQFYMSALMAAAMGIIELSIMGWMYQDKKRNALLITVFIFVLIAVFILIRGQTAIGDEQFLKSMIPHHSSAILMCKKAEITNSEIAQLCQKIILGQQSEIDQMKNLLESLK